MRQIDFITPVEAPLGRFLLDYSHRVMLMGSCFTEHIGHKLEETKFDVELNPYGVLYNPRSIATALRRIMEGTPYDSDSPELIQHGGCWHSLMHHGDFSSPDKAACLAGINARLQRAGSFLQRADVLVLTWGSAWVYRWASQTDMVVGNCHRLPDKQFLRTRLTPEEIATDYTSLIDALLHYNPRLRILLTVSPIRHRRDGLHGNQVSKATLMVAAERLVESRPEVVSYFPSYEIMMDELRDYRYYADDMLHPTPLAVEYIWQRFAEWFFSPVTKKFAEDWEKIRKALAHRPLHSGSDEHRRFVQALAEKIERIKEEYPDIDITKELAQCHHIH